jgi:phospholipid/cholesterol/gamma-HCH transport system substrate-binding protein
MPRKVSRFAIGLFVTMGLIMGAAAIVWLGASRYLEKGKRYATYFDESVQGLQRDSLVKYRGVEVGRVQAILVAPDNNLIEVVMKVDMKGDLVRTTVAQLRGVGITGIVFVDLDRRRPEEPDLSPRLTFASEYPIVPSRPSQFKQALGVLHEIFANVQEFDFRGISDDIRDTIRTIKTQLTDERVEAILANLESSSSKLERSMESIERALGDERLEGILIHADGALDEARGLVSDAREKIRGIKIARTVERADRLVEGWNRESRVISENIRTTSENLLRASEVLAELMERLNETPSDLILSQPPPPARGQ